MSCNPELRRLACVISVLSCYLCGPSGYWGLPPVLAEGAAELKTVARFVKVEASTDKNEFTVLEPITLIVKIESELLIESMLDKSNYRNVELLIKRVGSDAAIPKTEYARYIIDSVRQEVGDGRLPAHSPVEMKLKPNLVYDMTCPGSYEITVKFPFRISSTREWLYVKSVPITIKISDD